MLNEPQTPDRAGDGFDRESQAHEGFGPGELNSTPVDNQLGQGDRTGDRAGTFDRDELAATLNALPHDEWIVERTLSVSPFETTQIVRRNKGMLDTAFVRKVFARDSGLGAAYRLVFCAQAEGARFEHLPLIYDMTEVDEGVAVVTQLVQGETLQLYVERGNHGIELGMQVGLQLCDAMTELHEGFDAPIVHRDLKPGNIMMANGKLLLIDLGIARTWRTGAQRDTVRLGTPGYAPPEQFGYGQTSPQSDVYAAGMVIAFCLLGKHPSSELRETGFADPRIPEPVRAVLAKATALDATQRYPNARAMKEALAEAARSCRSPESPERARDISMQRGNAATAHKTESRASASKAGHSATREDGQNAGVSQGNPTMPGEEERGSFNKAGAASPPSAEVSRTYERDGQRLPFSIPRGIGVAWNALLGIAWSLFFLVCMSVALEGGTEFLDPLPLWFRIAAYLGMFVLPAAAVVVALADKRRLRNRFPLLGRYSWPKMALICVSFAAVCMVATIFIYGIFFTPAT